MNQLKFSLAIVLALIADFLFSLVCFLGTYLYTLGNISQSIMLAIIIFVLLGITAFGAIFLKRTSRNFKTCFVLEMIFIVMFTALLLFFSFSPFPHYFMVLDQKAEIQSKLSTSITQAENIFTEYEQYAENRITLYRTKLRSVAATKATKPSEYIAYGFENNGVSDERQIENKIFIVRADLFPTNHEETKQVASNWLANRRNMLNSWWAWNLGVIDVVNNVESKSNDWLNDLIGLSTIREHGEQAENFVYTLMFDDVKNHFTTLGSTTLLSVGLAVLAYLLMLLSWIVTKRDFRFPGFRIIFCSKKGKMDNEL